MGIELTVSEKRPSSCEQPQPACPARVVQCNVYRGPHLYSHMPMVRIQVQLGELEAWPTNRLPGFTDKLLKLLPGLAQHGCSAGNPGGFVERLRDGTWMGHVIEHVALELQCMSGDPVTRGKTRSVKGEPGGYNILYTYRNEAVGLLAGRIALDLISCLLPPQFGRIEGCELVAHSGIEPFSLSEALDQLGRLARKHRLGPSTQALVLEAEKRGIPWERLDEFSLVRIGTGRRQRQIRASVIGTTSHLGVDNASNKDLTKRLLSAIGVPAPEGEVVFTEERAIRAATNLGFPVVVKPLNANHGRGVTTDVKDAVCVSAAFLAARSHSKQVVVERYFAGKDFRILVVGGRVVAVAERDPANVIGDGVRTVAELVEDKNRDPRRGIGHENVMTRIEIDAAVMKYLESQSISSQSVPDKGRKVFIRQTANLSSGGSAVDCTDLIHPDNVSAAVRAAEAVGLDVAGIDFVTPDIARSWREVGGGVIEVNAGPGLRMHLSPSEGAARNVAAPILDTLFAGSARATIPVVAITGTNGKSTTVRMVARILRRKYRNVGFTSTSGIYLNDELLRPGDASGPRSAKLLLRDPSIDAVVLETARGGILREGLGFDRCEVGAVLNVTADHLGIGGIDSVEDLAQVKSVVTESVGRRGLSVLNADDANTPELARHAGGRLCLFSMKGLSQVERHVANGGLAVIREQQGRKDEIVILDATRRISVMECSAIPATLNGAAAFNLDNALAATAIAYGLNIDVGDIKAALSTFSSDYAQNPGRLNLHDGHGFRVVMDYAHNAAAMSRFLEMIEKMRPNYNRVIGSVSTPGDRRPDDIREMGRIAAHAFDLLVFRELPDNRGRPPGEVIGLLREGALSAGADPAKIVCVRPEEEATAICLKSAAPGDLVILTPTKIEATWKQVLEFVPKPCGTTAFGEPMHG